MSMHESIIDSIRNELSVTHLDLINESDQHSGPRDAETHFKLTCVAVEFEGLTRVKRHQLVYKILSQQLSSGVHALALHLYSEKEWVDSNQVPDSPSCLGGSKS